ENIDLYYKNKPRIFATVPRLLLFRAGLYNIVGNPPEEEILNFYSVHWHRNCLPYGSISFKF
ncbi:hypothetical protein, partial [Phocaeicola coprophilus]